MRGLAALRFGNGLFGERSGNSGKPRAFIANPAQRFKHLRHRLGVDPFAGADTSCNTVFPDAVYGYGSEPVGIMKRFSGLDRAHGFFAARTTDGGLTWTNPTVQKRTEQRADAEM